MQIVSIIIAALLSENYVLVKFLGICPFLGVSKRINAALGMGMAVTFVMALTSFVCYFVYQLLILLDLAYMQTVAFILVIASVVQLVEMFLKKKIPGLYKALGVYLPLITTNCAVLGVTINNITDGYDFVQSMVSALGVGLGFLLAMVLFSGLRSRIDESEVPKSFRGLAITLIAASFISLAFLGFAGIVDNLFA